MKNVKLYLTHYKNYKDWIIVMNNPNPNNALSMAQWTSIRLEQWLNIDYKDGQEGKGYESALEDFGGEVMTFEDTYYDKYAKKEYNIQTECIAFKNKEDAEKALEWLESRIIIERLI